MAVIYSYPLKTPKRDDLLIGTVTYDGCDQDSVVGNPTVSFTVGSLINLVEAQGAAQNLQQVTDIGSTTTNCITISNSLKVAGEYYDSSNQPGTSGQVLSSTATGTQWVSVGPQGVTSVGLSMPAAFTVANSPITQSGTLTVTGAGTAAQYINGLGNLVTFPTIPNEYVLPVATTVALGGIKIGYTQNAKNYPVALSNEQAYVNVPWTDTIYTLPLAADGTRGGAQIGYVENAKNYPVELSSEKMFVNVPWTDTPYVLPVATSSDLGGVKIGYTENAKNYPVELDSDQMYVNVPWTDTQNPFQTITGTGSDNTDSGILLSDSGGTVLILGSGSVTAAQTGNTITLTGINTWVANAVTVAGYVAAPAATDANLVWKTDANGNPAWRVDATIPDTGITTVALGTANSTGAPLSESITNRELTLTSNKYTGGANIGYVPEGGTSDLYLKGDGTWEAIPTGLIFKGTWDASGGGGGTPDLTQGTNKGDGFLWICDVAGTAYPNGGTNEPSTWALGDWAVYDGTAWTRVPATNSGVTSLTTTDGTFVNLTPSTATTGAVTVTADLSAQDGTSDTSTRFLSKDNTWDVPSYTTDTNTTYTVDVPTATTSINLKGSDGTDDAIVLTGGTNVTLSRTDASTIDIAATDTNTQNEYATSWVQSTDDILLRLTESGAGSGTQDIKIVKGANITFTYTDANNFTIAASDTQENTTWYIRDSANADKTVNNLKYLKFVTATGSLGTALTGAGSTTDPYLMTLTSPNTNNTYTAGTGLGLSSFEFSANVNATAQSTQPEAVSTDSNRTYAVQVDDTNDKLVVNVPWVSGGSYNWTIEDSTTGSSVVNTNESIQFVTATGALGTTLTEPSTGEFIMTLTSPNTMGSGFTVSADTNTAATTITQGDTLTIAGGTNVGTVSNPDGTITINATDTNTTYDLSSGTDTVLNLYNSPVVATAQAVGNSGSNTTILYDNESPAGGIVNGQYATGAGIPVGTRVVSHTTLGITFNQLVNVLNNTVISFRDVDTVAFTAGNNVTLTGTSNSIAIAADNTEYDFLAAATGGTNANPALRLGSTAGDTYDVVLTGSGGTTINRTGNTAITIDSDNDNNTYSLGSGNTKVITLTDTSTSTAVGTVTFVDGNDISISSPAANQIKITSNYSLPLASSTVRGGIKIGYNESGKNYPVKLSSEKAYVNVPWTDNNSVDYINAATFNTSNGILTGTGVGNAGFSVDLDGRYLEEPPTLAEVTAEGATTTTACSFTNQTSFLVGGSGRGSIYIGNNATSNYARFHTDNSNTYFDITCGDVIWREGSAGGSHRFEHNMTSGTFTAKGDIVAYGSPSDKRLKENIKPIESALDKVIKLQGVTFDWKKSDSVLDIKEDVGFIAQDVQKVIPELVRENKNGMLSMRHQGIAPILLEAIKELKAEIEELKCNKCNCNK
jgi:hypothetical protein